MALAVTQLGGGLFTGRASSSVNGDVFRGYKEDVSDQVSIISPAETLLLTALGDPDLPATQIYHQWVEDELAPNILIGSFAMTNTTTDSFLIVKSEAGRYMQVGAILRGPEAAGAEYFQIISVSPSTLGVTRQFGGTTANSFAASEPIVVISNASVEGADVLGDSSKARTFGANFTQIFKQDIVISGTTQAVIQHGVDDEMSYQVGKKLREMLRDLEKQVILGVLSGSTIGTNVNSRSFRGLIQGTITNSLAVSSIGTDFGSTTMQFFEDQINTAFGAAWANGGSDLNLVVCGRDIKRRFDQLNNQRVRVVNDESTYRNSVSRFEGLFGEFVVMLNRWMPTHMALLLATPRIKVKPLIARSFHLERVAKTGDAEKAMVVGEYTIEQKNEAGMAKLTFTSLAPAAGSALIAAR